MNEYFRFFGAALILLAAIIICRGYAGYTARALDEYDGFCSLLLHMRGKISCFLLPPSDIFADFECECLEKIGFLGELRYGISMSEAFASASPKLAINKESKRMLEGFFDAFGTEYREGELRRVEQALSEMKNYKEKAEAELPKSLKLTQTLISAAALGLVIFLI